ncbi:MAG: hypothetical protein MUF21_09265 [Gemmatimonadaceae bacterium]|jgi:hypothetical protein|nr:hypothetical protein [Gemmatimonadaceae bacterium]
MSARTARSRHDTLRRSTPRGSRGGAPLVHARPHALLLLLALAVGGCGRDADAAATRARRKAAVAVAARDRALLQRYVREADALDARLPALRRVTTGFVTGDTTVILAGYLAGDSLLAIDEILRAGETLRGQSRYVLRGDRLHYVALDRTQPGATPLAPERLRLALGFDSTARLVASSKNINDGAVNLDTAADVTALVLRSATLARRVSDAASAPAARSAPPPP